MNFSNHTVLHVIKSS